MQHGSSAPARLDFLAGQELGKHTPFPKPYTCNSMGVSMNEEGKRISYSYSMFLHGKGAVVFQ